MPRAKAPLTRAADRAFLRSVIEDLQDARRLRQIADRKVMAIRDSIVKRVASALWRRYSTYLKQGMIGKISFLAWLLSQGTLDRTYLKHSHRTRVYWVYRVIQSVKSPELAVTGEIEDQFGDWYIEGLEKAINAYQPGSSYRIALSEATTLSEWVDDVVPTIKFTKARD